MLEKYAILRFENIEDYQMVSTKISDCVFIAGIYNLAKA
jgi:hypothetical protein